MWPFSSAYPEVCIGDILDEYDYIIIGKYYHRQAMSN
jgi:hypothetical protein